MKENQKDLTQFIPKNLADPRIQAISLGPIKELLKEREKDKDSILQTYREEIARLKKKLSDTQKSIANFISYKTFRERLSFHCFQTYSDITILQCANRIRGGQCIGCLGRDQILEDLEAKPR